MKEYTIRKIGNTIYVLNGNSESGKSLTRNANFLGTGMALCGILKKGESLASWEKKLKKAQEIRNKEQPKKKNHVKKEITHHSS